MLVTDIKLYILLKVIVRIMISLYYLFMFFSYIQKCSCWKYNSVCKILNAQKVNQLVKLIIINGNLKNKYIIILCELFI